MSATLNKHDAYWAVGTLVTLLIVALAVIFILSSSYNQLVNSVKDDARALPILRMQKSTTQSQTPISNARTFGSTLSNNMTGIISCSVTLASLVLSLVAIGSTLIQGSDNAKLTTLSEANINSQQKLLDNMSTMLANIQKEHLANNTILKQIEAVAKISGSTCSGDFTVEELKNRLHQIHEMTIKKNDSNC